MTDQQTFTLSAGTVCKRNGIPFKLQHATQIECHPGVWPLIRGEPPELAEETVVAAPRPLAPCGAAEDMNTASRGSSTKCALPAQPEEHERHSECLFSGRVGPSAPLSLLSNEGRCVQCISKIGGPALCRRVSRCVTPGCLVRTSGTCSCPPLLVMVVWELPSLHWERWTPIP